MLPLHLFLAALMGVDVAVAVEMMDVVLSS